MYDISKLDWILYKRFTRKSKSDVVFIYFVYIANIDLLGN